MFVLKHINPYGEVFWFQNMGGFWHANDSRRLIEKTTTMQAEARTFETVEAAKEVLAITEARGWTVEPA